MINVWNEYHFPIGQFLGETVSKFLKDKKQVEHDVNTLRKCIF